MLNFINLKILKVDVSELAIMSGSLESYVNRPVSVITADGRNFIGTLKGFDQTINLILDESSHPPKALNRLSLGSTSCAATTSALSGRWTRMLIKDYTWATSRPTPSTPSHTQSSSSPPPATTPDLRFKFLTFPVVFFFATSMLHNFDGWLV